MSQQMSREEMIALLAKMQTENTALQEQAKLLKAQAASKIKLTVGQSGTVCLYHGSRYPVTLYREQWERILPFLKAGHVERFIEDNFDLLAIKAPKV